MLQNKIVNANYILSNKHDLNQRKNKTWEKILIDYHKIITDYKVNMNTVEKYGYYFIYRMHLLFKIYFHRVNILKDLYKF